MSLRRILCAILTLVILVASTPALAAEMPYAITVDLSSQIVTVYRTSDNTIARQMLCSAGKRNRTPTGEFTLPKNQCRREREDWMCFYATDCYVKYATRIHDSIMFHSLPYSAPKESAIWKDAVQNFGSPASHGCIRLLTEDAKFIAENCLAGTKVKIYKSGDKQEDLRDLLLQASYTGENGVSYNDFMGIPEDPTTLGRFSSGQEVTDLQYRLRALGYFSDEISGEYRTSTINAVKQVQADLGLNQNGQASVELREILYSSDAPTSMNVTLQEGMSGPVVRKLQNQLATLRLYDGDIDGVYDVDVMEAVRIFQQAYGYTPDSIATPEIQKAIYYEAGRLDALFAGVSDYDCQSVSESIKMVRVSASTGIRVRSEPSTESEALGRVTDGVCLLFLEESRGWSKVASDGKTGYIKNTFLKPYTQEINYLTYSSAQSDQVYTIGQTANDYRTGAAFPASIFADYLATNGSLDDYAGIVDYATVDTQQDGVMLNLRESPNTESAVLAALDNGTELRVLLKSTEWSLVSWQDQSGYLLNDYLDFWTGPEDYLEDSTELEALLALDAEDTPSRAVVQSDSGSAPVYDIDSEDANRLGTLNNGTEVTVLQTSDDWSLIELNGRQGYMSTDDLEFIVSAA